MCEYVSDSVWGIAVEDGFGFMVVVWCLPFAVYWHGCLFYLKKIMKKENRHKNLSKVCPMITIRFYSYILHSEPKITTVYIQ